MKKVLAIVVILSCLLSACSKGSYERPSDISQDVWDKSIQYAIIADNYSTDESSVISDGGLGIVLSRASSMKSKEGLSEKEQELAKSAYDMIAGRFDSLTGGSEKVVSEGQARYDDARKKVLSYVGENALSLSNLNQDFLDGFNNDAADIQDSIDNYSPVDEYMKQNNITLTAKDVQYDMSNKIDKDFVVAGEAELDDYYNYGFDNDSLYFCARVTPENGSYSDGWYLYFQRESFKELFEKLKNGNVNVIVTANIPKYKYEEEQGNMAEVRKVQYYK